MSPRENKYDEYRWTHIDNGDWDKINHGVENIVSFLRNAHYIELSMENAIYYDPQFSIHASTVFTILNFWINYGELSQ